MMDAKLKSLLEEPTKAISQSLPTLIEVVQQMQGWADEYREDELYERLEFIAELFDEADGYLKEIAKEIS